MAPPRRPAACGDATPLMTRGSHVYDGLAAGYDEAMRPLERWLLGRLRASALRELPAGARVLEVGAGTGANFQFYPRGARGACVELSGEMLARALAREERPPGVWLVRGQAEELPFGDDAFDAG